ncbi:MAG: SMI1 / KNR4 family protein [Planctomycetes bacterium ADurb.Bin126]|nr:MAG: SMI1 / KNR4 family protein [Planctomycetes bacterium ADurb.Bin126]HOD82471.1 SMI1/KNR4 family protein [Phycisphaerae bacterium]HQL72998.1 SMI1/KNR4 family protein [Phycisphaerae bacterium]
MIHWKEQLHQTLWAVDRLGGETERLLILPPADEDDVRTMESELGHALPPAMRRVMTGFSSRVHLGWTLPEGFVLPEPLRGLFGGQLTWDLMGLGELLSDADEWAHSLFDDPPPRELPLHDKLVFMPVGNGDFLAVDIEPAHYGEVVYLSRSSGSANGYLLARDFEDLLNRWLPLGCVGAEVWQWRPFTSGPTSGLDPECENARLWRKVLFRE